MTNHSGTWVKIVKIMAMAAYFWDNILKEWTFSREKITWTSSTDLHRKQTYSNSFSGIKN